MREKYDLIIAGLGAMGSNIAWRATVRGAKVVGLDRHHPPHEIGSSGGESRMVRRIYSEGAAFYRPLLVAEELWRDLERETSRAFLAPWRGIYIGRPDGRLVNGALRSVATTGLPVAVVGPREARDLLPCVRLSDQEVAIVDDGAGIIDARAAIEAALSAAARRGAGLHPGEAMLRWTGRPTGIHVLTTERELVADRLVLALGPFTTPRIARLPLPIRVTRQVVGWYHTDPSQGPSAVQGLTALFLAEQESGALLYGLPDRGRGIKLGIHEPGPTSVPGPSVRPPSGEELARIRQEAMDRLPGLTLRPIGSAICHYANTDDSRFIVDRHPGEPRVVIVSACSGHGFKFAPAVAEVACDLTLTDLSRPLASGGAFRSIRV